MISTSPRSGRAEVHLSCVITVVTALLTLLWVGGIGVAIVRESGAVPTRLAASVLVFGALLTALNGGAALLFLRAARLVTAEGAPGTPGLDHAPVERAARAARGVLLLGVVLTVPMVLAVGADSRAQHLPADPAELTSQWFAVMAAVSAAIAVAVAVAEWCAWVYLLAVVAAQAGGHLSSAGYQAGPELLAAGHAALMTVATCAFIFAAIYHLRLLAQYVDLALLRSAQEVADAASESAATSEAARIDGLVHDHVLAALLLASRADDPQDGPFVRRSAAAALAALSDIRAPEGSAGSATVDGGVSLGDFAAGLAREARAHDPFLAFADDGPADVTLPPCVATTMSAATLEAVRNSVRHAGVGLDRPVRRWITLRAQHSAVTITVGDDGAGFDPATAPTGRYGVSGSILGRMDGLDGGAGHITSAPGRGTLVDLAWTDPGAAATDTDSDRSVVEVAQDRADPASPEMHHLAHITRNLEEPMPVGARVRGGLVTGLGLAALGLLSVNDFTPPWPHLLVLATAGAWVVHLLVTWARSGLADLSTRTALAIGLWAPVAFLVSLVTWDGVANPELRLWTIALACMAPTLLCLANHPVIAWISSLTSGAVYLAWIFSHQGAAGLATMSWLMVALLPLAINPVQRASFTAMSSAASVATSHRADVDVQARETAALNARRTRGLRVDLLARPLLERLAAGERTGPAVRIEAAQLEAHLRDDLRARCFRDTEVARAAHDARRAGVRVELMDDGALDHASDRLREEVIAASVAVLDAAETGAVIIRVSPPDRDLVATIVASPNGAAPTRLEIHPDFLPAGAGDGRLTAEVA